MAAAGIITDAHFALLRIFKFGKENVSDGEKHTELIEWCNLQVAKLLQCTQKPAENKQYCWKQMLDKAELGYSCFLMTV